MQATKSKISRFCLSVCRYAVLRFNQYFKTKPAVMALQIPEWEEATEARRTRRGAQKEVCLKVKCWDFLSHEDASVSQLLMDHSSVSLASFSCNKRNYSLIPPNFSSMYVTAVAREWQKFHVCVCVQVHSSAFLIYVEKASCFSS